MSCRLDTVLRYRVSVTINILCDMKYLLCVQCNANNHTMFTLKSLLFCRMFRHLRLSHNVYIIIIYEIDHI